MYKYIYGIYGTSIHSFPFLKYEVPNRNIICMYMGNQGGSATTAISVLDLFISNSSVCREVLGVTSYLPTIVHTGND